MSQRKAKEYRQAMEQYRGVVVDVDDLKRRIGAMEARHRREDRDKVAEMYRRRALAMERADLEMTKAAEKAERARRAERQRKNERRRQIIRRRRIATVVCLAALLEQGYFSDAIPLPYDLQDIMRTACKEYGCPYPLALAVAEVESNFDAAAVGAVGEVGIMQLNPGPQNTYWVNLEAETGKDPTDTAGNIVCGVYLLGTHLANYEDTEKALMAYNMGPGGATQAWKAGTTSTGYTAKVMEAADRWAAVVG